MNGSRLDDWTERVFIIKTIPLFEALGNKPCLVALDGTISMSLDFENPLGINNIDTRYWRNKLPSVIFLESLKLLFHSNAPVRNTQCSLEVSRLSSGISSSVSHARG